MYFSRNFALVLIYTSIYDRAVISRLKMTDNNSRPEIISNYHHVQNIQQVSRTQKSTSHPISFIFYNTSDDNTDDKVKRGKRNIINEDPCGVGLKYLLSTPNAGITQSYSR